MLKKSIDLRKYTSCLVPKPALKLWHDFVRPGLPDWSFITIHYLYFLLVCFVASLMFWGSSTPPRAVSYTDSLFLVISAMTEAGLNTVNLSQLNTFQQVVLFVLIIFGSAIWVSIATVHIRKRAFEQKLQELADKRKTKLSLSRSFHISLSKTRRESSDLREAAVASGAVRGRAIANSNGSRRDNTNTNRSDRITFAPLDEEMAPVEHAGVGQCGEPEQSTAGQDELMSLPANGDLSLENRATDRENKPEVRLRIVDPPTLPEKVQFVGSAHHSTRNVGPNNGAPFRRSNTRIFSGGGVGARLDLNNHPRNAIQRFAGIIPVRDKGKRSEKVGGSFVIPEKYLRNFNGLIGRNSQFHGLTEKERRQLGGLEYDALALISYLVPLYFFLFQLLGAIGMGAWMQVNRPYIALQNGLHPFWTGSFFAIVGKNGHSRIATSNSSPECLQQLRHGKQPISDSQVTLKAQ
jgi:Cation transport protein